MHGWIGVAYSGKVMEQVHNRSQLCSYKTFKYLSGNFSRENKVSSYSVHRTGMIFFFTENATFTEISVYKTLKFQLRVQQER